MFLLDIKDYDVKENDTVIFSFGEIDCRCHVGKYPNNEEVIEKLVSGYLTAVNDNVKRFSSLKTRVYKIPPPAEKNTTKDNPDYPFVCSDEERKKYVTTFNGFLRKKCGD